jgi:undecaprenyl-diphosphatase
VVITVFGKVLVLFAQDYYPTRYDKITPRDYADEFDDEVALDLLAHVLIVDTKWTSRLVLSADARLLQNLMKFISHSCDSWYWLIGLGLIGLLGESKMRLLAAFWACAILAMAGVVFLIKMLFRRPRPEGEWGKIYRIADPHSFPSGHAARAMMLAVLSIQTSSSWVIAIFILWAVLVGLSRIALKLHYLLDVIAGWLLGAAGGLLALQLYPWFTQIIKALLN